jgi:hypothetical protein
MGMLKKFFSAILATATLSALAAQDFDENRPRTIASEQTAERKPNCSEFAFAAGCMGLGVGPVISTDSKGLVYGAGASFSYFVFDRLGAGLNGGAIFGSGYQDYSVGPALTYYIGPFGGYLLTPSLSASRHFVRGDVNYEGWAYGPSLGLMTNLFGRIYWGVSVGYFTYQAPGYKTTSEWSFSPVVFIPF